MEWPRGWRSPTASPSPWRAIRTCTRRERTSYGASSARARRTRPTSARSRSPPTAQSSASWSAGSLSWRLLDDELAHHAGLFVAGHLAVERVGAWCEGGAEARGAAVADDLAGALAVDGDV